MTEGSDNAEMVSMEKVLPTGVRCRCCWCELAVGGLHITVNIILLGLIV